MKRRCQLRKYMQSIKTLFFIHSTSHKTHTYFLYALYTPHTRSSLDTLSFTFNSSYNTLQTYHIQTVWIWIPNKRNLNRKDLSLKNSSQGSRRIMTNFLLLENQTNPIYLTGNPILLEVITWNVDSLVNEIWVGCSCIIVLGKKIILQ